MIELPKDRGDYAWNDFPKPHQKTCPFQDGRPCLHTCKFAVQVPLSERTKLYDPTHDFNCSMQASNAGMMRVARSLEFLIQELRLPPAEREPYTPEEQAEIERRKHE